MTTPSSDSRPARSIEKIELCLVIPCYNEEAVLPQLVAELKKFGDAASFRMRVLFIDDGSRDATYEGLSRLCREDARFGVIRFSRNFGHQTAVSAGLRFARGDVVAVLDADLQDPPPVLPAMLQKWAEGYDVVYGIRTQRKESALLRGAYAVFYRLLRHVANVELPLDAGDFSLMDRRVVDLINHMPEHNRFVRGLRGWVGFRQMGLPYERQGRAAGRPKYNVRRLFRLALDGLVSFSPAPLRLTCLLGLVTSLFGFALLVWALLSAWLDLAVPPGWASLAAMLLFFGGIQLIVLGIIGEYVGRIFEEVKNRPLFIISEQAGWVRAPGTTT